MTENRPSPSVSPRPEPSRRTILQAGAVGAALLTSCSARTAAAAPTSTRRTGAALTTPPNSAWNALARSLQGDLVRPGDSDYFEAKELFNPRWDGARPIAVVEAASVGDISTAIGFGRHWKLNVRPKAGGHSYVGVSTGTGVMVISTSRMAWVRGRWPASAGRSRPGPVPPSAPPGSPWAAGSGSPVASTA